MLLLLTALAYAPVVTAGFVRDDWVPILRARSVTMRQELNPLFPGHIEDLRPVMKILYKGMNALFKENPLPYHILSLVMHLACVLMVYRFARRSMARHAPATSNVALVATALFALHPAASEAVAWPAALATPLSTLFAIGALDTVSSEKNSRCASLLFAFTAYLTHESTALLAAVMIFIAWSEDRLRERGKILLAHTLLAAVFIAIWAAGPMVFNRPVATGCWRIGAHGFFHIAEYMVSLTLYPGLFLFPHGVGWLGFLRDPLWLHVAVDLLFASGVAFWVVKSKKRESAWLLSAMVLLLPVSFFVWGNSSRYLHLPAVFWCLAVASMGWRVYERSQIKRVWQAALVAILALFFMNDFIESRDHRREAIETGIALKTVESSIPEGAHSVELKDCPMHPDHLAAALRVMRNDIFFQVKCRQVEKLAHSPPRRE